MIGLALLATVVAPADNVTIGTLLPQMWDLRYLTQPPRPSFTMAQASSYDRASNPGPKSDPFANGDAGQFIRQETNSGRTEDIMADLKGPGAVVRVWSANPSGTIRFYFDGEETPRLEVPMADLLTGKGVPFGEPFSYGAAQGTDLYFPLPYEKSLKVTVEGSKGLYYHVGYRTYAAGTPVETYQTAKLKDYAPQIREAASHLSRLTTAATDKGGSRLTNTSNVQPRQRVVFVDMNKGGTIVQLQARIPFPLIQSLRPLDWVDPFQPHNVLRNLQIQVDADGERTIQAPLGDFFATTPGINPLKSLPFEVRQDGTMICRLPMPFRKSIKVAIVNTGSVPVPVTVGATVDRARPAADSYHLYAQWTGEYGQTRPMRDMTFLNVQGEGYWVGSNLHVANPTPAWWGEGDEKVYVDGETFPSTFGTGTEDYYGYAWCSPQLFNRPYHAQTRCDGPANAGHSDVHRWHIFDPIPYTQSFKFDLEMWHWADVKAQYDRTAYWYAKPGNTAPVAVDESQLALPLIEPPKPVLGAVEGEKLVVAEQNGGKLEHQSGFWELSSGEQLWWTDNKPGNRLTLKVPVAEDGTYEISGNFCHARDYGIHRILVNGQEAARIDFYGTGVEWIRHSLGTFNLTKGDNTLTIECVGKNEAALPSMMFGVDYLLIDKK